MQTGKAKVKIIYLQIVHINDPKISIRKCVQLENNSRKVSEYIVNSQKISSLPIYKRKTDRERNQVSNTCHSGLKNILVKL